MRTEWVEIRHEVPQKNSFWEFYALLPMWWTSCLELIELSQAQGSWKAKTTDDNSEQSTSEAPVHNTVVQVLNRKTK